MTTSQDFFMQKTRAGECDCGQFQEEKDKSPPNMHVSLIPLFALPLAIPPTASSPFHINQQGHIPQETTK